MNFKLYKTLFAVAIGLMMTACDKNEVLPAYTTIGKSTSTDASITASASKPTVGTEITLTLKYVNLSSDPAKTVLLKAKVGAGSYADLQTLDQSSAAKDKEIVHEIKYTPAVAGAVVFDMVLTSQMEFPLVRRVTITAQ